MTMNFNANCNQIEIADDMNKYTVMLAVPKCSREDSKIPSSRGAIFSGFRMNALNIFIVLSVALLLSVSMIQGTPVDSANPVEVSTVQSTTFSHKICHSSTPCGWAVYIPFTRRVDYFMRNTCSCPPEKACVKTDDDLSVSAYVYRCGEKPPGEESTPVYE